MDQQDISLVLKARQGYVISNPIGIISYTTDKPLATRFPLLRAMMVVSDILLKSAPVTVERADEPAAEEAVIAPIRSWRTEFTADHAVPPEIANLVANGILTDTSWKNDSCPSFGFKGYDLQEDQMRNIKSGDVTEARYRLWVEHPDQDQRCSIASSRFALTTEDDESQYLDTLLDTESVDEAVNEVLDRFFAHCVATAICPFCKKDTLHSYNDDGFVERIRNVTCDSCTSTWTEHMSLTHFTLGADVCP